MLKNAGHIYPKSIVIAIVISIFRFILSVIIRPKLPYNFIVDSLTIRRVMNSNILFFSGEDSYKSTALFFRMLGFTHQSSYLVEIIFSSVIYTLFLFVIIFVLGINLAKLIPFICISLLTFFSIVYFSMFSKDLIAFIFLSMSVIFNKSNKYNCWMVVMVLLYGFLFRAYWIIFAGYILLFYFMQNKRIRPIKQALFSFIALLGIGWGYQKIYGLYISQIRADTLSVLNANTKIQNLYPATSLLNDFFNSLYSLSNLLFPINGINSKNEIVYYFVLYAVLCLIIKSKKNEAIRISAIQIICSFLLVQALFEPDMGSALRHQIVVFIFPVLRMLVDKQERGNKFELFNCNSSLQFNRGHT